jgi:twinkle protein
MLGPLSVVYSVGSAGEVKKDLAHSYEYLVNNFERIYICFDNDEAGREATKAAKEILPAHKLYIFPHDEENKELKDANDYLQKNKEEEFVRRWWRASIPKVDGIVSSSEDYLKWLKEKPAQKFAYPFPTLQEKFHGIRSNELTLITAETGVGKSSFMREIEYEALMKTKDSIGLLHFEDSHQMKLFGLMNLWAGKRLHLPDSKHTEAEEKLAFDNTFGTGRLISLDNFGIYQPKLLLDRIEYLIKVYDCKFIFLDHITIAVAGIEDERVALDDLATKLRAACNSYDLSMFIISHVNDNGRTRSSRALEQLCDNHIHLYRDLLSEDPKLLNETKVMIKKNRFGSVTGYGGKLIWNEFTGKMSEA